MADGRECKLIIVTGKKRIGKSNETLRNLFYDVLKSGRKFLIFDVNNEYGKYKIYLPDGSVVIQPVKRIFHKDIARFSAQKKIEGARVIPVHDNGKSMMPEEIEDLMMKILTEFRGGALLLEDMNNIIGDSLPVKVSGALVNNAHRDCDIYIHMQSVGRILPKMRQNAEIVRFHYQLDGIEDSREKLKSEYELFKIAQLLVNKRYFTDNKRYFIFINREEHKLIGKFSKKDLAMAAYEYINTHRKVLQSLLDMRGAGGKKIYGYDQAVSMKTRELVEKYDGNSIAA